jgi:leader peptidase (prepilin peptidase)/N-methyltransferase
MNRALTGTMMYALADRMSGGYGTWVDTGCFVLAVIPIVIVDVREQRIPDALIIACALAICARRLIFSDGMSLWFLIDPCIGFGFLWVFWFLSKGRIGLGDAKLSGLVALWVGMPGWIVSLFAASTLGIGYASIQIVRGRMDRSDRIPFAPFLAGGALVGFAFVTWIYPWGRFW